ncbi:MAG: pilus assembly protein PilM [Pseudomonadales bacterium]
MLNGLINSFKKSTRRVSYGAIGVEPSLHSLNIVQLASQANGEPGINAWASVPYMGDREACIYAEKNLQQIVKQAFSKNKFHGRKINTVLPASDLKIMSVSYELQAGQSEVQAIAQRVSERVEGALQDYVVDYLPVRQQESKGKSTAIVAIARRERVIAYLECLRKAGLQVDCLEIGPASIKRLVAEMHKPKEGETVLVVNFGQRRSYLSIISGRRLLFDEQIAFGEALLLEKLEQVLGLSDQLSKTQIMQHGLGDDDGDNKVYCDTVDPEISSTILQVLKPSFMQLSENIRRALVYAVSETRGDPVTKIFLLGSVARWRGANKVVSDLLGIPVQVITDPLIRFRASGDMAEMFSENRPEFAVATGLALKGFSHRG